MLFSGAKIVAGLHGAGLANMAWMKPGGKIIEISPANRRTCYLHLASVASHQYSNIQIEDGVNYAKEIEKFVNS